MQLVYNGVEDIDAFTGGVSEDGDDERFGLALGLIFDFLVRTSAEQFSSATVFF